MMRRRNEIGSTAIETSLIITLITLIAFPAVIPLGGFVGYVTCNPIQYGTEHYGASYGVDMPLDTDQQWDIDERICTDRVTDASEDTPEELPPLCVILPAACSG